jgi:hypothetical protein
MVRNCLIMEVEEDSAVGFGKSWLVIIDKLNTVNMSRNFARILSLWRRIISLQGQFNPMVNRYL